MVAQWQERHRGHPQYQPLLRHEVYYLDPADILETRRTSRLMASPCIGGGPPELEDQCLLLRTRWPVCRLGERCAPERARHGGDVLRRARTTVNPDQVPGGDPFAELSIPMQHSAMSTTS
jgi:hypothetical protein